ncbi:innexin unc-7-like [Babylonia areolata]|uniref:innexin unc-7-like n=1 Tax=Babylonia areolata TaxID=304850 RepID=UPI003FCF574F
MELPARRDGDVDVDVFFPSCENGEKKSSSNAQLYDREKEEEDVMDDVRVRRFVRDFLGADGVFLVRIVQVNTNRVVMGELSVFRSAGEIVYANEITQVITVVFVLQAIILKLPQILWKELLEKTGSNVQIMINQVMDEQFDDAVKRESVIFKFASTLPNALNGDSSTEKAKGEGRRRGRVGQKLSTAFQGKIFWLYMLIKLIYLAVLAIQVWLLSTFFSFHFLEFGPRFISKSLLKQATSYVTDFREVVLCRFRSPVMTELPEEGVWVQCVLVFNHFLQNMLLLEWVGLVALGLLTILNVLLPATELKRARRDGDVDVDVFFPSCENGEKKSSSNAQLYDREKEEEDVMDDVRVRRFVRDFLGADGVFLVRIVQVNTNRVVMGELVRELYKIFLHCDAGDA